MQDSPVFSYINSLSPIQPVKSINTFQTLNSLALASPPSLFNSSHISLHRETRFSRRNHLTELSKPELSDCENDATSNMVSDLVQLTGNSARQNSLQTHNEHPELAIYLSKTLKYNFGSPDHSRLLQDVLKPDALHEIVSTPASVVHFSRDGSKDRYCTSESVINLQKTSQLEQNNEAAGSDWWKMISDAADLLALDSSLNEESPEKQDCQNLDSGKICRIVTSVQLPEKTNCDYSKTQSVDPAALFENSDKKLHVLLSGEVANLKEGVEVQENVYSTFLDKPTASNTNAEVDNKASNHVDTTCKPSLHQQRSIRRLVFELSGMHKTRPGYDCDSSFSALSHCESKLSSNENQKVSLRPAGYSSSMLSGIGLHLNALASSSKNVSLTMHEAPPSPGQLIGRPSRNSSFNLPKLLHGGESESCKRCNCKKSKCLKLYCECFAAGLYCVEPCSCQDCHNKPMHEETVLETRKQIESRNPLAFAPKVIRSSDSVREFGVRTLDEPNTPASARHKRGCNCKKSSCLKKYCECYQNVVHKGEQKNPDLVLPVKPLLDIGRPLVRLPFTLSSKLPQNSLPDGSSPQLCTSQKLKQSDFFGYLPKIEKRLERIPKDETPEILKSSCSATCGMKAISPNRKRVSPPHRKFASSTAWRSGRKLILRSIPSFSSLAQHENSDPSGKLT
ncbi:hypothetical protein RJ639_008283 [Escallonia herrerae]|uniref:CRC domain-containing protein n=1 Tax=Escallonia herrerae TaxID=1293975 RepID=A0AA88VS15_9ASTE|nr:hypothetical protein RJ639_008283 [Escallonia herrerae]